jgi:hypothetical protein
MVVNGAASFTSRNNKSSCPNCGEMADVLDGEFNTTGPVIKAIKADNWTRQKLAEYQEAIRWAAENIEADVGAALERIEAVDPRTASIVREWIRKNVTLKAVAVFLLALLALVAESAVDNLTSHLVDTFFESNDAPLIPAPLVDIDHTTIVQAPPEPTAHCESPNTTSPEQPPPLSGRSTHEETPQSPAPESSESPRRQADTPDHVPMPSPPEGVSPSQ